MNPTVPTVHLNGTSREELMAQRSNAIRAIHEAEQALRAMAPNARDFPSGGFSEAMGQHEQRADALRRVRASIEAERQAIFDTRKRPQDERHCPDCDFSAKNPTTVSLHRQAEH